MVTCFNSLIVDVMPGITTYLSALDVAALARTCKYFNALVCESEKKYCSYFAYVDAKYIHCHNTYSTETWIYLYERFMHLFVNLNLWLFLSYEHFDFIDYVWTADKNRILLMCEDDIEYTTRTMISEKWYKWIEISRAAILKKTHH